MSTDLRDRMAGAADEAPRTLSAGDLWAKGKARHSRRRVQGVLVAAALVAVVGGLVSLVGPFGGADPQPAKVSISDMHLPRTVYPPSPWSQATDVTGPPGRLAAVAMGRRLQPKGLTGSRESFAVYGVSAVDGTARFLDIPDVDTGEQGDVSVHSAVLSPDGTKVAVSLFRDGAQGEVPDAIGWDVYDTVSGTTQRLRVPGLDAIEGTETFEFRFSGDSRYLMTDYSQNDPSDNKSGALVVWDVDTGKSTVAEGTGHYWLPNPGSGPRGVVWSRGTRTFIFDPAKQTTSEVRVPQQVVEASIGPDEKAFAYIGHRRVGADQPAKWFLYVGRDEKSIAASPTNLDIEPGLILGWRDPTHVVVSNFQHAVRVVDLVTGDVERIRLGWSEGTAMKPVYASDLWANPIVAGVHPDHVPDPRWWIRAPGGPWSIFVGAGGLLALAWFLVRRRRHV